ncbi:hypothetical protein M0R45_017892 [Rubus argutus]|uniref:Uncharacterized protein n=1 Tax=Rubus argutus TaxID=59490 RepID=A0AAW1XZD8_RUBAR
MGLSQPRRCSLSSTGSSTKQSSAVSFAAMPNPPLTIEPVLDLYRRCHCLHPTPLTASPSIAAAIPSTDVEEPNTPNPILSCPPPPSRPRCSSSAHKPEPMLQPRL